MYKVKYGGKKGKTIKLVESADKVVVRTKGNQDVEEAELNAESREMLNQTTEVAAFPEAGVTVRKVTEQDDLESAGPGGAVRRRDMARNVLKKDDNIRFAGRVLEDADSGEVMLYTENFFIKFTNKTSESDCLALLEKYKLKVKSKLPFAPNAYFVEAEEGTGLEIFNISEQVLNEKIVEYCHPELVQERRFKGIHPLQWHLMRTSINGKTIDQHVNIEQAWGITRGAGITIAVIDDGCDIDHPEFEGKVVHPFDATLNVDDPRPKMRDDNHGTACSGLACAGGKDGGASGTAPEARLMPIRLRSGLGSMAETNAFVWAADHGADVISCSWGPVDGEWWNPDDPTHRRQVPMPDSTRLALEYALQKGRNGKGCCILFAAGNGNENIKNDGYASFPGVIAVAACNDTGRRSVYSDYGDAVWVSFPSGDFGWKAFQHPAPISDGLRTTDRISQAGYDPGDYVNSFGGTSGACPGMAGVVALMLAANPDLTPSEIKNIIRESCQKIDAQGGEYDEQGHSIWYGYGRIDAGMAVSKAAQLAGGTQIASQLISGKVSFSVEGTVDLLPGKLLGAAFVPGKRFLGFALQLAPGVKNVALKYSVNVSTTGIHTNAAPGEYVGAETGRQRVIGLAIRLEGPDAHKYEVGYAVRFKHVATLVNGRDGAWVGSQTNRGRTIEAVAIQVRKK